MGPYLTFGAKRSDQDFGLKISLENVYGVPNRNRETYLIPGSIGATIPAIQAAETWPNITRVYRAAAYRCKDPEKLTERLKEWLLNKSGYVELRDSYRSGFYQAYFSGDFEDVRKGVGNRNHEFPLTFSCRPFCFDEAPVPWITVEGGATRPFLNPYNYKAYPMLEIQGAALAPFDVEFRDSLNGEAVGKVHVASIGTEHDATLPLLVDLETTEAWFEGQELDPANEAVTVSGKAWFPANPLWDTSAPVSGASFLRCSKAGVTVYVNPRWWRL